MGEDVEGKGFQFVEGINGHVGNGLPSLIRESMVVKPFVRKHASEQDESEWHIRIRSDSIHTSGNATEQFSSEA
jgi:hypothetical protein